MHELSIAVALIEQVESAVQVENGRRVTRVCVDVGTLSGVDPDALELAYPVAAERSIAEGSELSMHVVQARIRCKQCKEETTPDFPFFACEKCGAAEVDFLSGRELVLRSIEMSVESNTPFTENVAP